MTGLQVLKAGFALAGLAASDFNTVINFLGSEFADLDATPKLVADHAGDGS